MDSDEEADDDDEDSEGDGEEDGSEDDSDEEGSTYELNDEELEAALAASSSKSGVDRDLLRKLIGSAADERSPSPPPAASTLAAPAVPGERPPPADLEPESKDPYDLYVRQLALEPRAHATDRLKTPLELAQEAAEQLRKQEERRLKRARGEQDESDDDDDENQGDGKKKRERKRAPQGDDLDDDYLQEQYGSDAEAAAAAADGEDGLGVGLEDAEELVVLGGDSDAEAESGDEEDGSEEESGEDDDDDDMDVGDLDAADSDDEAAAEGEQEALVAPSAAKFDAAGELPYTFPCPSSHAEFAKLLSSSGIKEQDTIIVVKRIRTLYHPGLAEGNKEKMQVFANVLLDHIVFLSASSSPTAFETINSILPPLLTLSHAYPLTCAPHYVKKIGLMHKNLLRGLIKGPLEPAAKTWPGVPELTLLRLVGMVWSTSDLSHPVVAPALLLISEYLSQCRVRSLSDVASGLFLCSLVAQYEQLSHRLVPEALNFLANAAALLLPTSASIVTSFPGYFPTPDLGQEHVKALKVRQATAKLAPSATVDLLGALASSAKGKAKASSPAVEQLKVDLASSTMKLVEVYRSMYTGSEAFIELFTPLERVLRSAKVAKLPPALAVRTTHFPSRIFVPLKLTSCRPRSPRLAKRFRAPSRSPVSLASRSTCSTTSRSRWRLISPSSTRASTRTVASTRTRSAQRPANFARCTGRRRRVRFASCGTTIGSSLSRRQSGSRTRTSSTRRRCVPRRRLPFPWQYADLSCCFRRSRKLSRACRTSERRRRRSSGPR